MTVVVGVDGSASALQAVRVAAGEAALREVALRIVHAFIWPLMHVPLGPSPYGPPTGGLRHEAERLLAEAAEAAVHAEPSLEVETLLVTGAAPAVLLSEAATAELIVVGDRGLGAIGEILIGSVALQVAAHSPVPVLVVKGRHGTAGHVVVGLDGSPAASRALDLGFRECALRDAELVAVHALAETAPFDVKPSTLYERDAAVGPERSSLGAAFERGLRRHPEVVAGEEIVVGDPAGNLLARARDAQLIIVGTHGRTGFLGLLLGSVAHHVLRHAPCPVLIVPPAEDRRPTDEDALDVADGSRDPSPRREPRSATATGQDSTGW